MQFFIRHVESLSSLVGLRPVHWSCLTLNTPGILCICKPRNLIVVRMQVCAGFDADPARPVLVAVAGPTFKIKLLTYTSKLLSVLFWCWTVSVKTISQLEWSRENSNSTFTTSRLVWLFSFLRGGPTPPLKLTSLGKTSFSWN